MKKLFFLALFAYLSFTLTSVIRPAFSLAGEVQPDKIRVAISSISVSQVNVWVPLEAGLFKKYGLYPEVVLISGAPVAVAALVAGEVSIVQGGSVGCISSNLRGSGTVFIAGGANRFPYQLVVAQNIQEISDLKGKRFAISRVGSADHFAAVSALPRFGLAADKDVSLIQVGPVPMRLAALTTGSVQGTLLIPPETIKAKELGYRILVNLMDLNVDYMQNGVYTTRQFVRSKPDIVRRFVAAYVEGNHYIHTNPKGTQKIMQKYLQGDEKTIEETYNVMVVKSTPKIPYPNKNGIQTVLNFMKKTVPEAATAKPDDFIEARFIKELEDSGFIARLYR